MMTSSSPDNTSAIGENIMSSLAKALSEDSYNIWFSEVSLVELSETEACFCVPDQIKSSWLAQNFSKEIQQAIMEIVGSPRQLKFLLPGEVPIEKEERSAKMIKGGGKTGKTSADVKKRSGINPIYTFKNYVMGPNNNFAYAAARAVAKTVNDSQKPMYNPLFIYGNSGLGKTHLIHAIGNEIIDKSNDSTVMYVTAEQFTNEFIDAIQTKKMKGFHERYRNVDVLIMDDVQFFSARERSQETFFHTFNTLFQSGKQIVITSDRPAGEIENMHQRLISRFECGLTTDLQTPGYETRVAILRQKRKDLNIEVSDEVLDFLANRIKKNVRRLEGALTRVAIFTSLGPDPNLTTEAMENLLRDLLREENSRQVTINLIQHQVAEYYGIRLSDMTSRRRPANIAFARQVAMYLSRRLTKSSLVEIGEAFGGRDHGTVIHAAKTIESRLLKDPDLNAAIDKLESTLS